MLEVVDRGRRDLRRRPRERGAARLATRAPPASTPAECALRSRARCRARRTTARAGRDSFSSTRGYDTYKPLRRRADRERQLQPFVGGTARLRGKRGVGGLAPAIRQQRILADASAGTSARRGPARTRRGTIGRARRRACRRTRGRGGGAAARASASTGAASAHRALRAGVTGPIADSGASSRSMRSTRSGLAITRGASRSSALSQSPHDCDDGQSAISARIGSANDRSARSCSRSRTSARTREASGSSELASRTRRSYSCSRPLRRRCQRSRRPITAASTIRSSHRHGARKRAGEIAIGFAARDLRLRLPPQAAHPRRVRRAAAPPRRCRRPAATRGRRCPLR